MPYTAEQQRKLLEQYGLDPERYEIVPHDEYYRPQAPTTLAPSLSPQSTAMGSAYRGAKRSLLPALAGVGTTAALAAIPGLGPIAAVAVPLIGGLGAGYGTAALQEKVKPTTPEEAAQREADLKEHAIASFAGELAPSLIALKPSLANVRTAFSRLPAAGASAADDAARAAILAQRLNVGLGGGLGALAEVGVPLARGEDVSPLRAALGTLGGAFINEPNRLGRALGFKPSTVAALRPSLEPATVAPRMPEPRGPGPEAGPIHAPAEAPRPQAPEPSVGIGAEDVDIDTYVRSGEGIPVDRQNYEQRLLVDKLERDISDAEARIRHLPLQERLERQAVLNDAKAKLAAEKERILTLKEQQDVIAVARGQPVTDPVAGQPKVFYVGKQNEVVPAAPKPEAPLTPAEMLAREQKTIQTKQQPKGPSDAPSTQPKPGIVQPERPGIPQGKDVPKDAPQVRQEKGRQTGRGGRVRAEAKGVLKPLPDDWRVTVQADQVLPTGERVPSGFVQFDKPDDTGSFGPKTIAAEGFEAPDFSKLPQGQYTVGEAKKQLAVQQSAQRLALRSELGLTAEETTTLLSARSPFDRGMHLMQMLHKRGIKVQALQHTPEGHRVAVEEALKQAADTVKRITGLDVAFKAGPNELPDVMHQAVSELSVVPLETLLRHPNNKAVFDLLSKLGARYGIEQGIESMIVGPGPEGWEIKFGITAFKQRVSKLNAALIAEDTQAHELTHIVIRDMINSDDPLAMRGLALFGGDEERLVQATGTRLHDLAKMRVEGLTLKRFTEWVKDLVAAIKARWFNATEDDFKRLLARRIIRGEKYIPSRIVVTDPEEVAYQTLANKQQDKREGLEAALAARTVAVEHGMPGMRSVVDRIRREVNPELGDGLANVDMEAARYRGRLTNRAQAGVETLTQAEQQEALRYAYDVLDNKGRATFEPTAKVLDWWEKSYRPFLRDVVAAHREVGKKIIDDGEGREIYEVPWYTPQMLREDVQDLLANHPNDPQAIKYRDMIVQHIAEQRGISKEQAFGIWETRGRAEHVTGQEGMLEYGPLSRAAGVGLPAAVRESDLNRLVTRYGNRAATALAWHKHVAGNPRVGYMAGVPDQFGKPHTRPSDLPADVEPYGRVPIVAEAVKILKGDFSPSDRFFDSFSRMVKVMMMQTLTGAADLTTWWAQVMPYVHPSRLGNIALAHVNVAKGIRDGLAMGVIQKHAMRMQSVMEGGEMKGVSRWITRWNKMADLVNTITGRDGLERVTRGLTMILGEMEAAANIAHAFNPAASRGLRDHAWRFLDTFADKDWAKSIGDIVKAGQPVPDDIIQRIAANLVDAAQGTYSIRGLPLAALKGEISPFLSLAKWNIEKANTFEKHVWGPLKRGNLTPFLMTTLGGIVGGSAVEQLREWMTKRKGAQPTWAEIAEAGGNGLLYKAMALSSFSGYGGIITELAKQGMDAVSGRPATGFRFPALAFISDTVERGSQAFHAVRQGENFLETFGVSMPLQLLKDHVQMARIGLAWGDTDEIEKANALRDLRTFRELRNLPTARWSGGGKNPFLSPLEREYEQATEPAQAVQMAGQLRQQAVERAGGDRERLRSLLNAYRAPSTDIMPSIRNNPQQFRRYLEWVRQTKGEAAAQQLLADYIKKEQMDRLKMALIPSLSAR